MSRRILTTSLAALALGLMPGIAAAQPAEAEPSAPEAPRASTPPAASSQEPSDDASAPKAPSGGAGAHTETVEAPEPSEVSVVGTRLKETSGSAHLIRPKQLERFEYDDPHQVLQSVPGVYVRTEDGFGLRPNIGMRGVASDRSKKIALMEDGLLFGPAPYSAPAAYYFPLITRMHSVKVVKGPGAIVYGPHTVAGAIDLVTAPVPEGEKASLDMAFGQYMSRKLHLRASAAGDSIGVMIEGVHLGNTGFKELDGGGDTGFSRNEWMAKARWIFGNRQVLQHQLELKATYSDEGSNETYLGLTEADFAANPYRRYASSQLDRMDWQRTGLVLSHEMSDGGDVSLRTSLYRNDLGRVWRRVQGLRGASLADVLANPDTPRNALFVSALRGDAPATTTDESIMVGPNDRAFVSQGLQTVLRYTPKTGPISHRVELGARVHYDSITRLHTQQGYRLEDGVMVEDGTNLETTTVNEAWTTALALWAVDAATWGPVTLTAGGRIESIQTRLEDGLSGVREGSTQQVLLPGAGLFVALPADFGLLGGVYQGFSPIPPGSGGNVRPEKSVNYEWGARYSPRGFRAEVIGFLNDYSNLTSQCTFSSGCTQDGLDQQFDGGEARALGLEAYVESELQLAEGVKLPGRVAYTLTDARFGSSFSSNDPTYGDVVEGDALPYVPPHQLAVSIGVETEKLGGNLGGTYVAAMRELAGQGEPDPLTTTDSVFLLDASVYAKPLSWWTIYAVGRNLLDTTYIASRRPFGLRPGAPIWLQIGTKLEY